MLSTEDLKQISGKGITEEQVKNQLEDFKKGFPFLKIDAAASVGNGVVAPADDMRKQYIEAWNNYKEALEAQKKLESFLGKFKAPQLKDGEEYEVPVIRK